jgi:hypothetical protein
MITLSIMLATFFATVDCRFQFFIDLFPLEHSQGLVFLMKSSAMAA